MRLSQYNVIQPLEVKHLLANTYTDNYLLLENELFLAYSSIQNDSNQIPELKNYYTEFYRELVKKGFLVSSIRNELEEVLSAIKEMDSDTERFRLIINPTMNCNFNCWYCYETHLKGSKMDLININKTLRFIDSVLETDIKSLNIGWFGGEPLLNFKKVILPVLQYAKIASRKKNINLSTNFTTNGFLLNQETINELLNFNVLNLQITLDGNKEKHNTIRYVSKTRGSYSKIVTNIGLATSNKINVVIMRIKG